MHKLLAPAFVAAAFAFWLGACDSLDVTDPNAPNSADVSLQSLVSGIEGSLRTDLFVYLVASAGLGREAYNMDAADPRWVGELIVGPLDPGGFILLRPWSARYRAIRNLHTLRDRAEAELAGSALAATQGFVSTLVAYQFLLNLNYLADNGIKLEVTGAEDVPFVSASEAYDRIEQLLDAGHASLQAGGVAFPFRLSAGFAGFDAPGTFARFNRGLRARVAVYRADHDAALAALSESFLDAAGDMDAGLYHVYSAGAGDQLNPLFAVPTASTVKLRAHEQLKEMAMPGDLRYANKILDRSDDASFDPAPTSGGGLSSALVVTVAASATAPLPIMRNEELLLLRAEAYIGKGDLGAAEADINRVRAAAGLSARALDSSTALDDLLRERRYSLFMEGHRWIDMRRHGRLDELPNDRPGDTIFRQFPKPIDEVFGGS